MSYLVCRLIFTAYKLLQKFLWPYTLKNEAWLCPRATVTVQMEKFGFQASALFQTMCIHTRQYRLMLETFFNQ